MKKDKLHIHWYPGHIAKAEKKLKEQLSLVDAVIEVVDARIPISSRYDNITRLLNQKPRFLLINKSDLVDRNELHKYIKYLEHETKVTVLPTTSLNLKDVKAIVNESVRLSEPKIQSLIAKGLLRRPARIMVVGLPNVGKSSIINKLTISSKTKTGAKAGVTRQQQWVRINPQLELLDTPGIIPMKQEDQQKAIKLAFVNSVGENAYSNEFVARALLDILNDKQKEVFKQFYNIAQDVDLTVENIAFSRKWLKQRNAPDIERTCAYILKDFRAGKIGKFILDEIPQQPAQT
ncbi:MAG: ribosome biogenesis GTPase YlqF [Cyanobacteriota bacterium]|nr:ribosome biogenesis GTPase YlqF [Cyanobacteriota bacterium]MDY6359218.1 ribosome biogenesis GTPase YlqF [Cyanobacteriota bacterium]MDY6363401.1 ribosome biogenesis GTPase YlqF [Cyanobacteriota bacterium]MDY6382500.1 ribosome biogenesis GTPase YlqF [Cyanobacteriota bacterium]